MATLFFDFVKITPNEAIVMTDEQAERLRDLLVKMYPRRGVSPAAADAGQSNVLR